MSSDDYFSYDNSCNKFEEFREKILEELRIDVNDYFFYYQNENKKYGIFNDFSFQTFKEISKGSKKVNINYKNKKEIFSQAFNYSLKQSILDISDLKRDNITKIIDNLINNFINDYISCLKEIHRRNKEVSNRKLTELKEISYDQKVNESFIDQITYENVIQNCREAPIPLDNNSKFFTPDKKEICHYCGNEDIKQLYGCKECKFKICEYCFQSLQIYKHFHPITFYKTN